MSEQSPLAILALAMVRLLSRPKWRVLIPLFLVLWGGQVSAQIADPGIRDTVRVDSVLVPAGDGVAVPVRFYNDEELGGVEITIFHPSPDLLFDSISFAGGRVSSITNKGWLRQGDTLSLFCVPFPGGISAGSGLFATIYYSTSQGMSPQSIPIDTTSLTEGQSTHITFFTTNNAETFRPSFRKGHVVVTGGCCQGVRGNANNDPNDRITVADLTYLVSYLFLSGTAPACPAEGNVNGSINDAPTVGDITFLVNYLFRSGSAPPACP